MDCIFCKIINKEIPAKIRYEDEDFIAFDDINPKAPTHILLLPKKHISSISSLQDQDSELMGRLILRARDIARDAGLDSFRSVINSGQDAGQEVDHIHMHILGGIQLGQIC